ncbi:response regulator [Vibrio pectenicida]|uniref:Sensory/regulatory protein RpfC n=1 Tax=Vibrio pectenicida TaxID=62763 RepID=A0A3R9FAB2_9VIBR|nr:response regulator [Vibrio pectenicida]RSD32449.1 response regulator [Vibrio pectenicida]
MNLETVIKEMEQASKEGSIKLAEYSIEDSPSIVDFRNKVKRLALDCQFSRVNSVRLATAVSEVCHNFLSTCDSFNVALFFSRNADLWGIELELNSAVGSVTSMNYDYIFDYFTVETASNHSHKLTAFKRFPNPNFYPKEHVDIQRNKLNQLSQQELMRELEISLEKTKEADVAKGDFLANMSHEIRTPMNAVIGLSELVLKTQLTSKQHDYISKINSAGRALLGIINDILDISKIEAGKMEMESIPFQLDKVFDDLCTIITLKAQEKGLEVIFSTPPELPNSLVGDPLRLGQILTNLCNNAIKFTEQGDIIVKVTNCEQLNEWVKLKFEIKDTGIGLKPEQIQKLFSAFSQADTSTTRKYGGTGLGLSICQNLVHLMNGDIWVESVYQEGSSFIFTAEFGVLDKEIENQQERVYNWKKLKGMKALVVDDNKSARDINQELLNSYSLEISTAVNGFEAIDMVKKAMAEDSPYELVLMDWQMPEMNGIKASEIIKTLDCPPKIILMTAYGREEVVLQASEAKIDGFLVKPVSASALLDTVMEVMGKAVVSDSSSQNNESEALYDSFATVRGAPVLLVEDNEVNQIIAIELLESVGLNVEVANNGKEGVDKALDGKFAIILMDLQMPVMDGLEAARVLREQPTQRELPIIAMTANAMQQDRERCAEAGMNDHIAKPIDTSELYSKLLKWIDPKFKDDNFEFASPQQSDDVADNVAFPELPGIDVEEGLSRVNDDRILFTKLLNSFSKNNQSTFSDLKTSWADKDYSQGEITAHTLKGASASLGAHRLSQVAFTFEQAFKLQDQDISESWNELSSALQQVLESIALIGLQPEVSLVQAQEFDCKVVIALSAEIREQLELGEFEEDSIANLIAMIQGHVKADQIDRLNDAVEIYDSDEALECLDTMLSSLQG